MGNDRVGPGQSADHGTYVFDNAAEQQTRARFAALPRIFDPGTIRHLEARGVGEGWRCLEAGAGGGSIATWLAVQVGSTGYVLATDIDTRFLGALARPNLEVRRHDIVGDPLPKATFDLVHTRLLLGHLPGRESALASMVAALKPGGWLLVEDFDALSMPPDVVINPVETRLRLHDGMCRVMTERGVDLRFGRLLPGRLHAHGLVDVDAEGRTLLWRGGSAGSELMRANFEQLRAPICETEGLAEQEFERELARLDDPSLLNPSPVMWAAWGRRP